MNAPPRTRLDEALVARGLAPSRSRARDMVKRGTVSVDGETEKRPARMIGSDNVIAAADEAARYVSRAALKLIAGLDTFGLDPAGRTVLDLGASTGGFTQVLLERGAAHVVAIDVGHEEMDSALASDPRVTLIEGLNARQLTPENLGGRRVEAIVADLSFISLKLALPPALSLAEPGAWGLFLVKPQFEVGRERLGKGGVVRDPEAARAAADDIAAWLENWHGGDAVTSPSRGGRSSPSEATVNSGRGAANTFEEIPPPETGSADASGPSWRVVGLLPSPISGGSGNTEFLFGAQFRPEHG